MTITLTPDIERILMERAARQGTTPELLALRDLRSLYIPEEPVVGNGNSTVADMPAIPLGTVNGSRAQALATMERLWGAMPQTGDVADAERDILAEAQAVRHGKPS